MKTKKTAGFIPYTIFRGLVIIWCFIRWGELPHQVDWKTLPSKLGIGTELNHQYKPITCSVQVKPREAKQEHKPPSAQNFYHLGTSKEPDSDGLPQLGKTVDRNETHQQSQNVSWKQVLSEITMEASP